MRTLRLSLVGTVILMLLGVAGGTSIAEDDQVSDPTAIVTGSMLEMTSDPSELEYSAEGVDGEPDWVGHGRGLMTMQTAEWSDPRLPSEIQSVANFDEYGPPGSAFYAFSSRWLLEGPDGYWEGPWTGFCDSVDHCHGTVILTGHGGYEGLYAVLAEKPGEGSSGGSGQVVEGVILFGEMPPMPDPVEPSTD